MKSLFILSLTLFSFQTIANESKFKEAALLKALNNSNLIGKYDSSCKLVFNQASSKTETLEFNGSDIVIETNEIFINVNQHGTKQLNKAVLRVEGEPTFIEDDSKKHLIEAKLVVSTPELEDLNENEKNSNSVKYLFITFDEQSNVISISAKINNPYLDGETALVERFGCK